MRLVAGRNTRANAETMLLLAWTEFVVLMKWGLKFVSFGFSSQEKV